MTAWKDMRKEWQELPKIRKRQIITFCLSVIACGILILVGLIQIADNMDSVSDEVRYFGGGVFIASAGFWLFNYFYIRNVDERNQYYREENRRGTE